jgi:Asp-tRNA(Asn)/Glu-tRNA(Gln) amidotransferase A subunit family amidase
VIEIYMDIVRLGENIRAGTVSPLKVVDGLLERIEALDPELNAFITVTAERAREQAISAAEEVGRVTSEALCTASRSASRTSTTPRA